MKVSKKLNKLARIDPTVRNCLYTMMQSGDTLEETLERLVIHLHREKVEATNRLIKCMEMSMLQVEKETPDENAK